MNKNKDNIIEFMGVNVPLVNKPIPNLVDKINSIVPIEGDFNRLSDKIKAKFGVEIFIDCERRPLGYVPQGCKAGCMIGTYIKDEMKQKQEDKNESKGNSTEKE